MTLRAQGSRTSEASKCRPTTGARSRRRAASGSGQGHGRAHTVARDVERIQHPEVKWGDVVRFRRGCGCARHGRRRNWRHSHHQRGSVRERQDGGYLRRRSSPSSSSRRSAPVLLGYGNWSKKGSKHVEDQLPLLSRKEMRPVWRDRRTSRQTRRAGKSSVANKFPVAFCVLRAHEGTGAPQSAGDLLMIKYR